MSNDLPRTIDLEHLGSPRVLSAHLHDGWLVDPGPQSTLPRLLEALDGEVPRAILLTHIHFDHAGSSGALLERFPGIELWVHERGAAHMVDPSRLIASARGVFGADFDRLWGAMQPVAPERVRIVAGGEQIGPWHVAYTPGHAKHHVSYYHEPTAVAFSGDVTGVRICGGPTLPPTPPPDIDIELWHASLERIAAWNPRALAFMHFGVTSEDVAEQIAATHQALDMLAQAARTRDGPEMTEWVRQWLLANGAEQSIGSYISTGSVESSWAGLRRYWQQRAEPESAQPPT